ncbi:hypothetical protein NJB1507_08400 [Mycobacterium marinum]|uniref:hypothetical protein n=1 Tax=Mycobacterium marinum TaxID=1781 RepID=UPI0021C4657B|nr:hypothetical protein [Mycobacterium marinum]GJO17872.1 hypothetical protein NJB1507_08400 [Mycobacterium marinum]
MALDTPLNTRQLDVLRWIGEGCPDGRWSNTSYKATAAALQNRCLITVSKRGGWKATIKPAGTYYLEHGDYPTDHFPNKRRSHSRVIRLAHSEQGTPQRSLACPGPDEPTPTRKLLQDIIEAGGVLELNAKGDDTNYGSLVAIINRRQMAPDGQQVILMDGTSYYQKVLRLSSVAEWKTLPPAEVVAADRIGRWHPAVAALRSENRLTSIEPPQRQRALRLLHALAREAEARGHTVNEAPKREQRGYGHHDRDHLPGCVIVGVTPVRCGIGITQLQDKVPHEATMKELERAKRESWYRVPTHDYVPSKRLSITLNTDSRYSSGVSWADTKTIPLESRLPDVMTLFERWALIHTERTEAERLAEIEKRKRQEREDELACEAYAQHALGERLIADMKEWELAGRLRHYLADMAERIGHIANEEQRAAAIEWMQWCEQYSGKCDPLTKPIRQPKVKPPDYNDLRDFRQRLGFVQRW